MVEGATCTFALCCKATRLFENTTQGINRMKTERSRILQPNLTGQSDKKKTKRALGFYFGMIERTLQVLAVGEEAAGGFG